jgi:hypothetical protein
MLIGLDFDNTIVCYDRAIATLADEIPDLPEDLPRTKLYLRDHLRAAGREAEWTAFQGTLYGPGMCHAEPFEGAVQTLQQLATNGHRLVIVSHRSLRPYAGPPHDLHAAARGWVAERLQSAGLFGEGESYTVSPVNFLETRDAKVAAIAQLGCDVFVDDLPEVLDAPGFPASTAPVLFDPADELPQRAGRHQLRTWQQLPAVLAQLG